MCERITWLARPRQGRQIMLGEGQAVNGARFGAAMGTMALIEEDSLVLVTLSAQDSEISLL